MNLIFNRYEQIRPVSQNEPTSYVSSDQYRQELRAASGEILYQRNDARPNSSNDASYRNDVSPHTSINEQYQHRLPPAVSRPSDNSRPQSRENKLPKSHSRPLSRENVTNLSVISTQRNNSYDFIPKLSFTQLKHKLPPNLQQQPQVPADKISHRSPDKVF